MPALSAHRLVSALLNAWEDSGAPAVLLNAATRHPRRFLAQTPRGNVEIWVYIWTLTHGGRASLPDEYRVQMTTVRPPLPVAPDGHTALLGYEPNLGMFAGFDLERHHVFTSGSPSVQIDIKCIHKALQDGLAFDRKDNGEIAVGVRPDQLLNYVVNQHSFHRYGASAAMCALLGKACSLEPISQAVMSSMPKERQRVVSTVSRMSRDASFRQQVLAAYGNRCAVTRMQLRLVEAAHILPVGAQGSVDAVQNGLALSPTIHRAFDNALIYLDENCVMRINPAKEAQLAAMRLDGGLPDFRKDLERRIHLPSDRRQWPEARFIRKANASRLISV